MNTVLQNLAKFIRDLMSFSEADIFIGRQGFRVDDFSGRQVVVDSTGSIIPKTVSSKFDGTAEEMTYSHQIITPCTINFYGDSAYSDATAFVLSVRSQSGYELQRDIGIGVYDIGQLIDVKMLTGEQYNGRIQVNLNVLSSISLAVSTLRIDTAELDDLHWEA